MPATLLPHSPLRPQAHSYQPLRPSQSHFHTVRGLRLHLRQWGDTADIRPERPALVMLHGWMDVGASFQFLVDAMAEQGDAPRCILAPDWRGFGLSEANLGGAYWFADYLADLEGLLQQHLGHSQAIDLLGHSLGANVALAYGGVRPQRVRKLVNLEGFGLPPTRPEQAPGRLAQWLDSLQAPAELRPYASADDVAQRLKKTNPRLRADRAAWLARQWAREQADGTWQILADPAHKRPHGSLYREEETLALWRRISAPVLYVEGDDSDLFKVWKDSYPREAIHRNLGVIAHLERHSLSPAGHMVHHDQPEALAERIAAFLQSVHASTSAG
jgi:pimeloyl-ACP methyl ester carboxylesterase